MGRATYLPLLLSLFYGVFGAHRNPVVDTKLGPIRGVPAPDGDYSMYMGIPYATVNSSNPFGAASPHTGFETTFNANDDSIVCPQREEFNSTIIGSLDCLRLNVYVPNSAGPNNRRPVLVHIYGGGFILGFGGRFQYEPRFLVSHDVIIVTFNYRLGAYGFLCLDTPEVPGNSGLKDQLLALRWIKNNIEAFGGDSDQITVSGQSAGAVSVDFQLTYTKEDLFHRAIMQSGTALTPFALRNSDPDAALKLASRLGYNTTITDYALRFLATLDPRYIVAATEGLLKVLPCVEKDFGNADRFITEHPTSVKVPKAKSVPILIGFNSNELGPMYANEEPEMLQRMRVFTQLGDYFNFDDKYGATQEDIVRHFYIGDDDLTPEVRDQLVDFGTDFNIYHPTYRTIQKYIDNGESTIYHYVFSYDGDRNFVKVKNNVTDVPGALHADELGYLFDIAILNDTPYPEDQLMIDRMTTMWTNFVKYSDPTPSITSTLTVRWPPIEKDALYCLNIDSNLTVQKRPLYDRMAFWDLFYELNTPYLKV